MESFFLPTPPSSPRPPPWASTQSSPTIEDILKQLEEMVVTLKQQDEQRENRDKQLKDLKVEIHNLGDHFTHMEEKIHNLEDVWRSWSRSNIIVCAAEILKWSIQMQGEGEGEGEEDGDIQHFDHLSDSTLILSASEALEMTVEDYIKLVQRCFTDRNNTVHYGNLLSLDEDVEDCQECIRVFPDLRHSLPDQCKVIDSYNNFKHYLPDSFC